MSLLSIFKKMTLHAGQRGRARSHNGDRKLAHGYWPTAYVGCGLLLMVSCILRPSLPRTTPATMKNHIHCYDKILN